MTIWGQKYICTNDCRFYIGVYLFSPPPPELQVWLFSQKCVTQTEGGRCFPVLPEETATHVESDSAGHIKHTMCTLHVTVCAIPCACVWPEEEHGVRHLVANAQYFNNNSV